MILLLTKTSARTKMLKCFGNGEFASITKSAYFKYYLNSVLMGT